MKFFKYASLCIMGILTVIAMNNCTDESEDGIGNDDSDNSSETDSQDNTGGEEVEAGTNSISVKVTANTNSLNITGSNLSSFVKVSESSAVQNAIQDKIASNFPAAKINEMDLANGSVNFTKEEAFFDPNVEPAGLPSEATADEMARGRLSDLSLLPDNEDEIVVDHVGGVNTASVDEKTGKTIIKRNLVTVYYGRKLNGLPVKGNSKMVAYLGGSGELNGVIKKWTKVKSGTKFSNSDVKSATAAVDDMKKLIQAQLANHKSMIKGVEISKVQLVMYDDGNVIEPALYSEGGVASTNGEVEQNYWITPILTTPKATYSIKQKAQTYSTHPGTADENVGGQAVRSR